VSIGVAQDPRDGAFPDRLIAAADQALYDAKKSGGNGDATYEPSPPLVPEASATPEMVLRKRA
jgi:predicted signal transduction protein with EAL and GGDEF domain